MENGNYLTDRQKIARAEGMLELGKALCTNGLAVKESETDRIRNILQTTVDAALSALRCEDD